MDEPVCRAGHGTGRQDGQDQRQQKTKWPQKAQKGKDSARGLLKLCVRHQGSILKTTVPQTPFDSSTFCASCTFCGGTSQLNPDWHDKAIATKGTKYTKKPETRQTT